MKLLEVRRLGLCDYLQTVSLQEELVRQRRVGSIPDTLLMLEHEPVITVGRGRNGGLPPWPPSLNREGGNGNGKGKGDGGLPPWPPSLNREGGNGNGNGVPVVETSRGGQATYHGPGQLVAYPILDLRQWRTDLHWYLRQLEATGIATLRRYGLRAGNMPGHTGVWIEGKKVASIGVAVRGWITYHGLALNVTCDMSGFDGFRPCGLAPETMVSLRELGLSAGVAEVAVAFEKAFQAVFGYGSMCIL